MKIFRPKELVIVDIFYFLPDYSHILNEFIWQVDDYYPEIPRVHKFLGYWNANIEAVINEVYIQHSSESSWRRIDFIGE
jgi:uncharacterized protein Usg